MKRVSIFLALLLAACASTPPPALPQPGSAQFDIEATVLAAYNVVSGPAGRRDWKVFKELFTPDGRIVMNGQSMTPDDFQKSVNDELQKTGLFERPVATRVDVAGNIAHVWSRYEALHATTDAQPFARGTRSFQLIKSGDRWMIVSILMQPE
jgi:SnoaL-like protein